MKMIKKLSIDKPIEEVWEVLGSQFGEIDKWSSLISHSEVSGEAKIPGLNYSIRSTKTTGGDTKQELTGFDPTKYMIAYKALTGFPGFIKAIDAEWNLTKINEQSTNLVLDFNVNFKGLGVILTPIVKSKFGKTGDILLDDMKYYIENGKPHARKAAALKK